MPLSEKALRQVVNVVKPIASRAMFLAGFSYYEAGGRFPSYYAYGFGSKATTTTERAQQAYLFFQILTLSLSTACAFICHLLLFYIYHRPSAAYSGAFADSVKMNVRLVFRMVLFSHVSYCCSLILIGFVYFPNEPFALVLCIVVFSLLLVYTFFAATSIAKAFVDIEAMPDDELRDNIKTSALNKPASASATSLQSFETSPEYCISVLNSIGGSAVLLLAFAVTCISRYIPTSSCTFDNGRQAVPTQPLVFPIEVLNGRSSASFPACTEHVEKNAYIVFAVASALCGYITSIHGVCMYTLVVNYASDMQKEAFVKRVYGKFILGVLAFFVGVLFLFLALAFNCYGTQTSRVVVTALSSTATQWTRDERAADAPFYICISLAFILFFGIARLRQAVTLGNTNSPAAPESFPSDVVATGAREFRLAVARSTAASGDANIVCGYILYNIVTFGTDVAGLSSDTEQVPYQLAFLLVNVLACAFALLSVIWGLFINVWSSVSDSNIFRFFFILRAKPVTRLAYFLFLLSLNLMMVTMALFGKAKYPTPAPPSGYKLVQNPAPLTKDDVLIDYKELYDRQIAAIIAPAACGIIGIVLINTGLFVINMAYKFSKNNPVSVQVELEGKTLDKVAKRFEVLRRLSSNVMFFGCFAWNGVNFMYKTHVPNGAAYVAAMAISFISAITVVAWSSFMQVQSKILEKHDIQSVGCREAFRRKTAPIFVAAVVLFTVSVMSFVYAFSIIGFIKPWVQTADLVEIDFIAPHLLGALPAGSKGLVNRLANPYWVEIVIVSDYLNYTLPMTIAGCCILAFTIAVTLYAAVCIRRTLAEAAVRERAARHQMTVVNPAAATVDRVPAAASAAAPAVNSAAADQSALDEAEHSMECLGVFNNQASFVAGNVFFEIVFSSITFNSAPVFAYFVLSSLAFALGTIVIVISVIVPVALSNVHGEGGRKNALMLKLKPLVGLSHNLCVCHTFFFTASLLVWGPIKFPPFSWMTYTLPALALLLMAQQLHDIRSRCLISHREAETGASVSDLL